MPEILDESDINGKAATEALVSYLISACYISKHDEVVCDELRDKYIKCEICADEVYKTVYPMLTADEQFRIEAIVQNGLPICSNPVCPVTSTK